MPMGVPLPSAVGMLCGKSQELSIEATLDAVAEHKGSFDGKDLGVL